jgi:transposase
MAVGDLSGWPTADQLDLQALHRVRERLVSQRTGIINQIRAFLLERGIAVRQGQRFLRAELPRILAMPPDVLSPRTSSCQYRYRPRRLRR